MVRLFAFRKSLRVASLHLVALALSSVAIMASAAPASARPHHGMARYAHAHYYGRHAVRHTSSHFAYHHHRHVARGSRWERGMAQMQAESLADTNDGLSPAAGFGDMGISRGSGSSNVVAEARRYLGGNPTGLGSLWCARFMNLVLEHTGYKGTGSDAAASFANYGQRVSGPQVGAIAVMGWRGGGGHVGIITGIDASGNPIMISGNNGNRVKEAPISRGLIYAYVMPTG
jgi:uncharacterized protein (TIGR02594 family)